MAAYRQSKELQLLYGSPNSVAGAVSCECEFVVLGLLVLGPVQPAVGLSTPGSRTTAQQRTKWTLATMTAAQYTGTLESCCGRLNRYTCSECRLNLYNAGQHDS